MVSGFYTYRGNNIFQTIGVLRRFRWKKKCPFLLVGVSQSSSKAAFRVDDNAGQSPRMCFIVSSFCLHRRQIQIKSIFLLFVYFKSCSTPMVCNSLFPPQIYNPDISNSLRYHSFFHHSKSRGTPNGTLIFPLKSHPVCLWLQIYYSIP